MKSYDHSRKKIDKEINESQNLVGKLKKKNSENEDGIQSLTKMVEIFEQEIKIVEERTSYIQEKNWLV